VVVNLPEGPHMVDVGCGAPFSQPIPLDRVSEVRRAGLTYRFTPDFAAMTCEQERLIDGEWRNFCRYDLTPASPEARQAAYERHNTPGESWVLGDIVMISFLDNGDIAAIREGAFTLYRDDGKQSRKLTGRADYIRTVREELRLPKVPIGLGLEALSQIKGEDG
jgi:arylamine N-acetyltransferase